MATDEMVKVREASTPPKGQGAVGAGVAGAV
jgi:hypothetical protein